MTVCSTQALSIPLPEEIRNLPRHKTACKYCGISYFMFRELTVLRQKLESACKALSLYDTKLATEILSGEPASLCRTQEDMQNLRSSFFTLRQFVQLTFDDIQSTTRQYEQAILQKSEAYLARTRQMHTQNTQMLTAKVDENEAKLRLHSQNKTELDATQAQLIHLQRHLADVTHCRDDLAKINSEMEQKVSVDFRLMKADLQEKSRKCEDLSQALTVEIDKTRVAVEQAGLKDNENVALRNELSENENKLTRLHQSMSHSTNQGRATLLAVQLLISHVQEPLQAQMDRAATLTRLLSATSAALQHLQTSVAACKTKMTCLKAANSTKNDKSDRTIHQLLAEQKGQFDQTLQQIHSHHEADLSKCGKRLTTLKSEYESLLKKSATDRTLMETKITNLQGNLEEERKRYTLQLSTTSQSYTKLTEMRLSETKRANMAEQKLQENLTTLDTLTAKISVLTDTIRDQKTEMNHLLHVVKCQCEERLALLKTITRHPQKTPLNNNTKTDSDSKK